MAVGADKEAKDKVGVGVTGRWVGVYFVQELMMLLLACAQRDRTALMMAWRGDHLEVMQALKAAGAKPWSPGCWGE